MPGSIELRKKRVLIVGLARTGVATALFCAGHNAIVTATETRPENELADAPARLREAGVTLELGGHKERTYLTQDLIVPSPGVPADDPFLLTARSKGITVWSEIELAYRFLEGKLIGVTGSNGKTTTATLVHHILRTAASHTRPMSTCTGRMRWSGIGFGFGAQFMLARRFALTGPLHRIPTALAARASARGRP